METIKNRGGVRKKERLPHALSYGIRNLCVFQQRKALVPNRRT
jgi:hypothetical protein